MESAVHRMNFSHMSKLRALHVPIHDDIVKNCIGSGKVEVVRWLFENKLVFTDTQALMGLAITLGKFDIVAVLESFGVAVPPLAYSLRMDLGRIDAGFLAKNKHEWDDPHEAERVLDVALKKKDGAILDLVVGTKLLSEVSISMALVDTGDVEFFRRVLPKMNYNNCIYDKKKWWEKVIRAPKFLDVMLDEVWTGHTTREWLLLVAVQMIAKDAVASLIQRGTDVNKRVNHYPTLYVFAKVLLELRASSKDNADALAIWDMLIQAGANPRELFWDPKTGMRSTSVVGLLALTRRHSLIEPFLDVEE